MKKCLYSSKKCIVFDTFYKIFAFIVQKRLAAQLDPFLQKTQFGFRKDRSTADAIHCIRRAAEHGEQTQKQAHFVLLEYVNIYIYIYVIYIYIYIYRYLYIYNRFAYGT